MFPQNLPMEWERDDLHLEEYYWIIGVMIIVSLLKAFDW
jgi:hypothetical protein